MAEIILPTAFRVNVVEYDIWAGSKIDSVKYFDDELEAIAWCTRYNAINDDDRAPDWYMQAEFVGKVF